MTLLDVALNLHDAGLCVLPAAGDGSKRPGVPSWHGYQHTRPTRERLEGMVEHASGIGAVCGAVSGGLVMIELEGRSVHLLADIDSAAKASGLKPLMDRIVAGYTETTPSGGLHWLVRTTGEAPGNLKLARDAAGLVLAETRGEGGWVVLAPSHGTTHATGKPWQMVLGGPSTIATVTPDELDAIFALFRTFDVYRPVAAPVEVKPDPFGPRAASVGTPETRASAITPGDDYANRHDWRDILAGWTELYTKSDGRTYWRRPGKDEGISASTGGAADGVDRLFVFSTSAAPFEIETPYSKFAAYTTLEHGGDYSAAARALSAAGYGEKRDPKVTASSHTGEPNERSGSSPVSDDLARRKVRLSSASGIEPLIAKWLWAKRIPLGSLALIAGREGIGKSTVGYDLAAHITRGTLLGTYEGQPRGVIVAASEDSWAHTIIPRLMAAGADLDRVWQVDVVTPEGQEVEISLPVDIDGLEVEVADKDVALILLDPLMSRLSGTLDTHKDAEVRQALEPLVGLADRTQASVVGLIHVNKSVTNDPLTQIMGSRAFAAVARSVLFVMRDPEEDSVRLLGLVKCNVGPTNIPTLMFQIESAHVADIAEGAVWSSRIEWVGETERSIADFMSAHDEPEKLTALIDEVATWLESYLTEGPKPKSVVAESGEILGYKLRTLDRAKDRLGVLSRRDGFGGGAIWALPGVNGQTGQSETSSFMPSPRGDMTVGMNDQTRTEGPI